MTQRAGGTTPEDASASEGQSPAQTPADSATRRIEFWHEWRPIVVPLGLMAVGLVLAYRLIERSGAGRLPDYLPLHTMLETFTVVVAALIFSVGWNAYRRHQPANILWLGCAFLGVALCDFSHMLSYTGMPDFVTPSGPNKAIWFWLAGRSLAAGAILVAVLRPWRPARHAGERYLLLAGVLAAVAAVHWVILYHADALPIVYVPDVGLTPFKVRFEFCIIGVNVATAVILVSRLGKPQAFHVGGLLGAVCAMAMSEFFFTRYLDFADAFNLIGHVYKIVSYLFLYFALFVETIEAPYGQLMATLEAMPEMLFEVRTEGTVVFYHQAAHTRFFAGPDEDLLGRRVDEILPPDVAQAFLLAQARAARTGHAQAGPFELDTLDGRRWFRLSASRKAVAGSDPHVIVLLHDVTSIKEAEDAIQHLAFYDQLTGLANRRLLIDRLRQSLAASARSGNEGALLFLDLDNFKSLNDTLGHDFGDRLLQQVAVRLRGCVRESDTVARLGGDEFVVMLEGLGTSELGAAEQAEAVGNKILHCLNQPYDLGGRDYHNSPSIGVTLFRNQRENSEELLKQADIAMYQAKKAGRNTLRFFDPRMQGAVTSRALLESELRRALERRQLDLHYQVQVDEQGRPFGAEALLRWATPERGFVSPAVFIPLAEESGMILKIGQWVLETACAQLEAWSRDRALARLRLCVNISAKQLRQEDFARQVGALLLAHGVDPGRLDLELTESTLLDNIEESIATLRALKDIGVRITLDDFGTGYSSLQYLKRLPLDQLKIDQSFVRDLATDENDRAIVQTIIAMAHSLRFEVIAEGVESARQRDQLLAMGCRRFQGFLFGKPQAIGPFESAHRAARESAL